MEIFVTVCYIHCDAVEMGEFLGYLWKYCTYWEMDV